MIRPNETAPGNGAMTFRLQIQHLRRAVPEQYRRKMKTVELWSRDADRKILLILGVLFCFALSGGIGALLPEPVPADNVEIVQALLGIVLLMLTWASFRLLRPVRYRRGWVIAEALSVPLVWLLEITVLGIWFAHLQSTWGLQIE